MSKSLREMAAEVADLNAEKGWRTIHRSFPEEMMLIVTEVAEAVEVFRTDGLAPVTLPGGKPADAKSELADILIRLLDSAEKYGVDLEYEYERKMAYNRTRSYRHGGKRL